MMTEINPDNSEEIKVTQIGVNKPTSSIQTAHGTVT